VIRARVSVTGSGIVECDPGGVVVEKELDPKRIVVVDGVGEDAVARSRVGKKRSSPWKKTSTPSPPLPKTPLPEIMLPAPAAVPPIVLSSASAWMDTPSSPFPS
jgi:hypothetical protein